MTSTEPARDGYTARRRSRSGGPPIAGEKQHEAARRNVEKAQTAAKQQQTLKNLPARTHSALGKESAAVRRGESPSRGELESGARRLDIKGRSKMGKAELKRAVARAKSV